MLNLHLSDSLEEFYSDRLRLISRNSEDYLVLRILLFSSVSLYRIEDTDVHSYNNLLS